MLEAIAVLVCLGAILYQAPVPAIGLIFIIYVIGKGEVPNPNCPHCKARKYRK